MHYKQLPTAREEYAKRAREYAWELRERAAGRSSIATCEVTPEGWILYDLWLKVETQPYASASWEGEYFLVLVEGGSIIETYRVTNDEWHDFPSMPRGWGIPF